MERLLSVFAHVRRGEGSTALLLMLNVFVLLTAYYNIKPVREALILGSAGAEIKSYAGAAQAILFVVILPVYGSSASRMNRARLINGTDYSIQNTARHALFLRTSHDAEYKAQPATDSFFWRAGNKLP